MKPETECMVMEEVAFLTLELNKFCGFASIHMFRLFNFLFHNTWFLMSNGKRLIYLPQLYNTNDMISLTKLILNAQVIFIQIAEEYREKVK